MNLKAYLANTLSFIIELKLGNQRHCERNSKIYALKTRLNEMVFLNGRMNGNSYH